MKLVLKHTVGDGYTYSCEVLIPFEYESKEKFVFDVLEHFKDKVWKEWKYDDGNQVMYEEVEFMGVMMNKFDIEGIEHDVMSIDEWFEKDKIEVFKKSKTE